MRTPAGLVVALLGCALVALGCFLPAGEATSPVLIVRSNSLVQMGGGLWLLGGALLAGWASWSAAQSRETTWHVVTLGCLGVIATAWIGSTLKLDNGTELDPNVGVYAVGLGSVLVAAGGLILGGENRRVRSEDRPDTPAAD